MIKRQLDFLLACRKVVAKFGSFDAVRREGGARVQFVLNELDAQYLQLQQQFEEGQKALHVLWQLLYAQGKQAYLRIEADPPLVAHQDLLFV